MQELDNSDDPLIPIKEAASQIGVSYDSIKSWAREKKIPSEWHGTKKFVRQSVITETIDLRDQFGAEWADHVNWIVADEDNQSTESFEENKPEMEIMTIPQRIVEKGKRLEAEGRFEAACVLYSILIDHCDWNSL